VKNEEGIRCINSILKTAKGAISIKDNQWTLQKTQRLASADKREERQSGGQVGRRKRLRKNIAGGETKKRVRREVTTRGRSWQGGGVVEGVKKRKKREEKGESEFQIGVM